MTVDAAGRPWRFCESLDEMIEEVVGLGATTTTVFPAGETLYLPLVSSAWDLVTLRIRIRQVLETWAVGSLLVARDLLEVVQ